MKKSMGRIVFAFIIVSGLALGSCTHENNSPSQPTVQLDVRATTALSTLNPAGRTQASGLTFDTILLGVTKIKFQTHDESHRESEMDMMHGPDSDDQSDSLNSEFKGSFILDLIKGTSTPDFGIATITPGVFDQIKFKLGPVLDSGNSIYVSFSYLPAGVANPVRFVFSSKARIKLEIRKKDGFKIDSLGLHPILITMDLDHMFSGVDLSTAVPGSDGVIRINKDSNADLYELIIHSFREGMKGGEDRNHDHHIDG
jgi:hypothetical protein